MVFCLHREMLYLLQREEGLLWVVSRGEDWASCTQTCTSNPHLKLSLSNKEAERRLKCCTPVSDYRLGLDGPQTTDADTQTSKHTDKIQQIVTHRKNKTKRKRSPLGHNPWVLSASGGETPQQEHCLITLVIRLESCSRHHASKESLHKDKRQCLHIHCKQEEEIWSVIEGARNKTDI